MINEIEIVDYKGFKNLKLDNLSQINIISGKNNIGKTALLEAIFLYERITFSYHYLGIYLLPFLSISKNRDITDNRINEYLKDINLLAKTNELEMNVQYRKNYNLTAYSTTSTQKHAKLIKK